MNYAGTDGYAAHCAAVPSACSPNAPCDLYMATINGMDPNETPLEFSVRDRILFLAQVPNLTVRGFWFRDSGGHTTSAAVTLVGAPNARVTDNWAVGNSAGGLGVKGGGGPIYLARNVVNANGLYGGSVANTTGAEINDETYWFNNWRGEQVGFLGVFTAGAKYSVVHDADIQGVHASHNFGHGLWPDYANSDWRASGLTAINNAGTGLYLEINENPDLLSFTDATLTGNRTGVAIVDSANVDLTSGEKKVAGRRPPPGLRDSPVVALAVA